VKYYKTLYGDIKDKDLGGYFEGKNSLKHCLPLENTRLEANCGSISLRELQVEGSVYAMRKSSFLSLVISASRALNGSC
jgi:hypothetical protein